MLFVETLPAESQRRALSLQAAGAAPVQEANFADGDDALREAVVRLRSRQGESVRPLGASLEGRAAITSLIVGAGVAGSTLAALLAREGRAVVLIGPPPAGDGPRIGESLPGFAARWLQSNALPGPLAVGSPHWAVPGSVTAWERKPVVQSYISSPWGVHYRLDRSAFDRDLYRVALERGARAQPHDAISLARTKGGWRAVLETGEAIEGAHLIDATGRRAWATRRLRQPHAEKEAMIAVWAIGSKTTGKDRRTVTETVATSWWYGCLLPNGQPLACLHCPRQMAQELVRHEDRSRRIA